MNKKLLVSIVIGSLFLIIIIAVGLNSLRGGFLSQFQSFSLTVINDSDFEVELVEMGVLQSADSGNSIEEKSKQTYSIPLESGKQTVIKPRLSITGEGGIYLKYIDATGENIRKTVCSYTESGSGYTIATITNNNVQIQEKCN
ncbi:hypothetical protein [Paenibacillus sp. TC-CSREp1]|uniref:hypothetical protein n=1 Tax=Paenibacillus sp. TC-CSREp1 TaxID=3410089 RepID=UPI003D083A08